MIEIVKSPLVLGIGNVLMGDEGVGVHAIRHLEKEEHFGEATFLDGGTGGFHLLSLLQDYDPIIMIDATMDGRPAGTVTLLHPKFASEFPRTLSAHDIGLRDLLESAQLLGALPELHLITVSIDEIQSVQMELSHAVMKALPNVARMVEELLTATVLS